jgi:hypothetical protein
MLLFRSEEHVDRWCEAWHLERGAILSPQRAWRLAQQWYAVDRRDPAWRRPTLEESEAILSNLELVGPFWNLR